MSNFHDRNTAITRVAQYAGQPQQQYQNEPQYFRPAEMAYGRRLARAAVWSETKPFFMTSEFVGTLVCILGICITAAATSDLNSHGAAMFSTILVAAYVVSRGIAKAGTRSRATDPRDDTTEPRDDMHLGSHAHNSH